MVMTDENDDVCCDTNDFLYNQFPNSIVLFIIWDSILYNEKFCNKPSLHNHLTYKTETMIKTIDNDGSTIGDND